MKSDEIIHEINNLSISERLLLIEDIWGAVAQSNEELSISEW